jgi:hypothetical protein
VSRPPRNRALDLAAIALLATTLVAATLLVGACNRKPPQFVPAGADSTAVTADSFAVLVGAALERWDAQDGDGAAPATARLLLDDLRRHPDQRLADRARTFVDSCGFSAELAGSIDIAAVSFFSRSDPGGESWPFLFWRGADQMRFQAIEGSGMRLLDLAQRPIEAGRDAATAPHQAAAIYGRTGPRGQQPVVISWRRPPDGKRWTLAQTLGPDSLGGVGVAEFVGEAGGGTGLEARTYRPTAGFDECPTCPHIYRTLRFTWAPEGFRKTSEEVASSPYYTFVQFIAALSVNDREMAQRLVSDPVLLDTAAQNEWNKSKGLWRLAPGTDESASEMTFFRGSREAYKVRFTSRGGSWVITDLHPTQRSVE